VSLQAKERIFSDPLWNTGK